MDTVTKVHEETYLTSNVKISLGVTPNLRGNFISSAARIAQEQEHYLKFELVTAESSARLVEKLRLHKINCAVVSDTDLLRTLPHIKSPNCLRTKSPGSFQVR